MLIVQITLLFFLTSCALFQERSSLKEMDKEELLNSVKLIGEGRGRLGLGQNQYVFSFDSILKDNFDWILAVQIPLHGEEVMILPDLKQEKLQKWQMHSFEERIKKDFLRLNLDKVLAPQQFLEELRSLIRFHLSSSWGSKRNCKVQQSEFWCEQDGQRYLVTTSEKELSIKKSLGQGKSLVLDARNLTESFFAQTDIRLYSNETNQLKKDSSFSLELFWKN
jgi:hypothetical protein